MVSYLAQWLKKPAFLKSKELLIPKQKSQHSKVIFLLSLENVLHISLARWVFVDCTFIIPSSFILILILQESHPIISLDALLAVGGFPNKEHKSSITASIASVSW